MEDRQRETSTSVGSGLLDARIAHGWYEFYTELTTPITVQTLLSPSVKIRTVKVTKSKAADSVAAGESAANDPNVMHKIAIAPDTR